MANPFEFEKMTPMLRQYFSLKAEAADSILFFRMGDFYEIFGDDAVDVAKKLQIVLTSRERGDKQKIPFCGVPLHSVGTYWRKLLGLGHSIAVAEQTQDPKEAKGLVERKIVKTLTPGCVDDLELLTDDEPKEVISLQVAEGGESWTALKFEISLGEISQRTFASIQGVVSFIERVRPAEVWIRKSIFPVLKQHLSPRMESEAFWQWIEEELFLTDDQDRQKYLSHLDKGSQQLLADNLVVSNLYMATIAKLERLGFHNTVFTKLSDNHESVRAELGESCLRDLEVFETSMRRDRKASLFHHMHHCLTPMGSRQLVYELKNPLKNRESIQARQLIVAKMVDEAANWLSPLRNKLRSVGDLARIQQRIKRRNIRPSELRGFVSQLLAATSCIKDFVKDSAYEASFSDLVVSYDQFLVFLDKLVSSISLEENRFFKEGFDEKLDGLFYQKNNGDQEILSYLSSEKERTGISNLKVKSHKTFGLLLEVSKANLSKVPENYLRKQTMTNHERFLTEELTELFERLELSEQKHSEQEQKLFSDFVDSIAAELPVCERFVQELSLLDLLQGFAWLSSKHNLVCPDVVLAGPFQVKGARHLVVESIIGEHQFVSNDLEMGIDQKTMVITGPNMAGKSTYMRQTAIIALMNQIGCFVPARRARLPVFDAIYTRVGAADDLSRGQSTFMVEMVEAAEILKLATSRSLVILDEIGRGTSTQDGLALATAILDDLVERVDCYTMFATHYHEIIPFASKQNRIQIVQSEVIDAASGVEFTHKMVPGASGNSFGIEVAKLAGLPAHIVRNAQEHLGKSKTFPQNRIQKPEGITPSEVSAPAVVAPEWLAGRDRETIAEIINRLELLRVHRMTPLQALNIINNFKELLDAPQQQGLLWEEAAR